jgi:uncharacterized membrane protein YfcA
MYEYIIQIILGLITGAFLGITGIAPTGLVLILLEYFKIGEYKKNLGAILLINMFPLTIGSVYEFYKAKKINYELGIILLGTVMLGSYIGSKMVVGNGFTLSLKQSKYITSLLGLFIFILFFNSAYYERN